ncbi:hypothetical protein [Aeromicrobium sp. UC242_57]|uniref:hypothetical protein n=1 Tax=Aeromicrobium sp. UC242_57 TaxID=3374624 RepID=UPI0037BC2112
MYLLDTFSLFATLSAVMALPSLKVIDAATSVPGFRAVVDGFVLSCAPSRCC